MATLRLGTRGSDLARWQADHVAGLLRAARPEIAIEIVVITTTGDRVLDAPLAKIGGKGLFTKEIEEALLERRIDLAVHSLKDLPTVLPDGLALAAVLSRTDPRDVWIAASGRTLRRDARRARGSAPRVSGGRRSSCTRGRTCASKRCGEMFRRV